MIILMCRSIRRRNKKVRDYLPIRIKYYLLVCLKMISILICLTGLMLDKLELVYRVVSIYGLGALLECLECMNLEDKEIHFVASIFYQEAIEQSWVYLEVIWLYLICKNKNTKDTKVFIWEEQVLQEVQLVQYVQEGEMVTSVLEI